MLEPFLDKMAAWRTETKRELAKYWWWPAVGLIMTFVERLTEHRLYAFCNDYLDAHFIDSIKSVAAWLSTPTLRTLLIAIILVVVPLLVIIIHAYVTSTRAVGESSEQQKNLLSRTRNLVSELQTFVDEQEGNVHAIHFGYDAQFRPRVDKIFSELAALEIFDVVEGDWIINPQTQTARNIKNNVIARLESLAERLAIREAAPRFNLIGDVESAKVVMSGESRVRDGEREYHTDIALSSELPTMLIWMQPLSEPR